MTKLAEREYLSFIQRALEEDIGTGDITSSSIVPPGSVTTGELIAKESGVAAGIEVAYYTFATLDKSVRFLKKFDDGQYIDRGDVIAEVKGPGRALLTAERVALNFLQRMSGIATLTRMYVERVKGTRVKILDTRKTAPGLRSLDKLAVRLGGGENHRFGLYDMALIKENHIHIAGGIEEAVHRLRAHYSDLPVEIEIKSLTELEEALKMAPDRILADNMDLETLKKAVLAVNDKVPIEASGNITLENVEDIAQTGVDFISVGALTHSVKALDISFSLNH